MRKANDAYKLEGWAKVLIAIAGVLILFAFFAPYVFTRPTNKFSFALSEQGQIGDALGGLMNPFIGLAGVIVTGLAFYMQYKANLIQRKLSEDAINESRQQFEKQVREQNNQHKIEQFENHFFEMLRLHKENVNELELQPTGESPYKGRLVFQRALTDIHRILNSSQPIYTIQDGDIMPNDNEVFSSKFHDAYTVFFWGKITGISYKYNQINFSFAHAPTIGLATRNWNALLGHYYRHLYHMVKYAVESKVIENYEDKMRYLTILRAQLSNHEQIMLFYNWLAGYGENWENHENEFADANKRHQYFTKYRMIHNVLSSEVYQAQYILDALQKLDEKSMALIRKPLLEEEE